MPHPTITLDRRVLLGLDALTEPHSAVLRGGVTAAVRAVSDFLVNEPQTLKLADRDREEMMLRVAVASVCQYNSTGKREPPYWLISNVANVVRSAFADILSTANGPTTEDRGARAAVEFAASVAGNGIPTPAHSRSYDGTSIFAKQFGSRMWSVEFGNNGDPTVAQAGGSDPPDSYDAADPQDAAAGYVDFYRTYGPPTTADRPVRG